MRTIADYDQQLIAKYGIFTLLFSMLFFHILKTIVNFYGAPKVVPDKDEWRWKNLFVSWIHALIVGSWNLACMVIYPEMFEDLSNHFTLFSYLVIVFSTGYFLYDFCDMLFNNKLLKFWEVSLHHVVVLSSFIYVTYYMVQIGYVCMALLAEANSIFLHARKLMQMQKVPFDNSLYRFNCVLNMVSFVAGRGTGLFVITRFLILTPELLTPFFRWLVIVGVFIMDVIHPVLFWRLLKSDFIKPWLKNRRLKSETPTALDKSNEIHIVNGINGFRNNNDLKTA
ncbi:TLC domain-containing protein 2-like [Tubulanus polymorphus]|uniref:TLC domain-containing protein 2-like n=1 Tax=Tubulanus polymorphus TaxID=672921 RepID=UPI003DA578DE